MQARPICKWNGGKAWLAPQILELLPKDWAAGRYFEPFAGGAALFWALRPRRAVLSDANAELVNLYRAVRDDVDSVIAKLREHDSAYRELGAAYYYGRREESPKRMHEQAARTIFLNKTGFNGLYRVNRKGGFNVPHGRTSSGEPPVICDAANLRACSAALQGVQIGAAQFMDVMSAGPVAGDLVYLDPPYVPEPGKASFVGYTADGFADERHEAVARVFRGLAERGVYVLASNSRTERVRELYREFRQIEVARPGGNNSDTTKRQQVPELLIVGWERV